MSAITPQSARPQRPAPKSPAWRHALFFVRPFSPSRLLFSSRLLSPLLLAAAVSCLLPLSAALPAHADAPKNSILAIRTILDGRRPTTYNITVTSTAEFPMNNSVVTLNIGGQEFINSSYAPGGTLNTLVFSLTRRQFLSLKSGSSVAVYYGADNAALPAAQWSFGPLNLAMLDKASPIVPVSVAPISIAPVSIAPVKIIVKNSVKASKAAVTSSAHAASPHSATAPSASPQGGKK